MESKSYSKGVSYWLLIGCVMVVVQVLLGGITRLTGSGLSITEWNVIMGWIPPLNDLQWEEAFDKYKQFPQFHLLNSEMDLSGFKSIFFWEYLHRVWARLIGVVFLLPFLYFLVRKKFSASFVQLLLILFALGALQGLVGWMMVSTGLKDRPWVTPLSLSTHLLLALLTYCFIYWVYLNYNQRERTNNLSITYLNGLIMLTGVQLLFGGFMAGSHAALNFNTWPSMNGSFIPMGLWNEQLSFFKNFVENNTWIQFIHRNTAYVLTLAIVVFWFLNRTKKGVNELHWLLLIIFVQVALGITTILLSVGKITLVWAVAHQGCAIILLTLLLRLRYKAQPAL